MNKQSFPEFTGLELSTRKVDCLKLILEKGGVKNNGNLLQPAGRPFDHKQNLKRTCSSWIPEPYPL